MNNLLALILLALPLTTFSEIAPSSFSSEMEYLKASSKEIKLYLPSDELLQQDEISTGQAALKKEEKSTAAELLDEIENEELNDTFRKPLLRRK